VERLRLVVRAFLSRTMRTRLARRLVLPVFPPVQLWLLRLTRGRFNITDLLVPSLVLHHTGARSGQPRETPLMCWPQPDGSFLVAGSNWGKPQHPAWTVNLLAHPDASVLVRGRTLAVRAEPIVDADREAAWRLLEAQWPGYREYERAAGRPVRMFRLVPR
jgi:deazaflavin-dependent oxidoreductase (nitroreductase family)